MTPMHQFYFNLACMGARWLKCSRCGDVVQWTLHQIPFGHEDDHVINLEIAHALKGCNGALYEHSPYVEEAAPQVSV